MCGQFSVKFKRRKKKERSQNLKKKNIGSIQLWTHCEEFLPIPNWGKWLSWKMNWKLDISSLWIKKIRRNEEACTLTENFTILCSHNSPKRQFSCSVREPAINRLWGSTFAKCSVRATQAIMDLFEQVVWFFLINRKRLRDPHHYYFLKSLFFWITWKFPKME